MAEGNTTGVRKPKLTIKQAKFVKAKAEGKTGVAAAQEAYPNLDYNSARVVASQNLAKLNIQEALEAEFTRQGITLEAIVKPIKDGLTASKINIVRDPLGGEDSAFAEETPDHSIRLKASSMAAQFIGIGRNNNEGGTTTLNFINVAKDDKGDYGL
jgi:hypothetical protein